MVDALASGASGGDPVEVQVLSSAPIRYPVRGHQKPRNALTFQRFFPSTAPLALPPTVSHGRKYGARMEPVYGPGRRPVERCEEPGDLLGREELRPVPPPGRPSASACCPAREGWMCSFTVPVAMCCCRSTPMFPPTKWALPIGREIRSGAWRKKAKRNERRAWLTTTSGVDLSLVIPTRCHSDHFPVIPTEGRNPVPLPPQDFSLRSK